MDRSTVVFDFIGLCFVVGTMALTLHLAGGLERPQLEPPTVVLDTLYAPEPHCRRAGQYPLGNRQRDSVAVMLVCRERQP